MSHVFRAIACLEGFEALTRPVPPSRPAATAAALPAAPPPAPRILVIVDPGGEVTRALTVVRAIALDTGAAVRLTVVRGIPAAVRDRMDRVRISSERMLDRLEARILDDLGRMAARHLDGVPVSTRVVFGDPDVETARAAEAFGAGMVVLTAEPPRPWPTRLRRLTAGVTWPIAVIHVRAMRAPA